MAVNVTVDFDLQVSLFFSVLAISNHLTTCKYFLHAGGSNTEEIIVNGIKCIINAHRLVPVEDLYF